VLKYNAILHGFAEGYALMKRLLSNTETARSIMTGAIAGIALALAFIAGFYARGAVLAPSSVPADAAGYPLVDEVQGLLDRAYLREQPDYSVRQYAAVRGLLSSLGDPNTFFIEPPVAQSESDVLAGTYGGIGVLLSRNEAGDFVIYPFEDSPAHLAGIQDGAILVAINGNPIESSATPDAIDQMLRGEVSEGSGVELRVLQGEEEESLFIEFAVINVPSVVWRLLEDNRIGYVQILRFTARTPEELHAGLEELNTAGVEALVLDMRNNSGGLLDESIDAASEFVARGVIIYEVSNSSEQTFNALDGGIATELPIVVLVNNRTASAAELVAGAIRDNGRGIIIGQRSYGKGTVQQIFSLSDGSSIHITSAEWFTPNRTPIAGVGLVPDIEINPDAEGRDIELAEAIRYIQEEFGD
jgi:carboxyl-terminal processing protease